MEDNTLNQELTATTPSEEDGFFDDYVEDTNDITPDEEVTEDNSSNDDTTQEEVQEEVSNQPFLNIRYNKEDIGLSQEEAINYAQKGMNYDKLNERYSSLNSNLERLAQANGLSVDDYLTRLEDVQTNFEVGQELEALKEQYPDTNEEALKELAQSRVAQRRGENLREEQISLQREQQAQEQAEKDYMANDVQHFMNLYPNVNIRDLPQEVWDMVDKGETVTYAYTAYRNKQLEQNKPQLEAKQRAQELNVQNQARNIGSTTNVSGAKKDDFLEGWDEF